MVQVTDDTPKEFAFKQLPLSKELLSTLKEIGYHFATPVQAGSIGPAINGRDLMVQSQTGTGKTAAFTIPIIEKLKSTNHTAALVLAPTRELARQVMEEATRLSANSPSFSVTCVYGGVSFEEQVKKLKKQPNLIVGTPGRVLDHLRRKTLDLRQLKCFVLDEADEMLSMGFAEDLEDILKFIPKQRQTLFFSATFPPSVKRYASKTLQDPLFLSYLDENSSADDLEHYYMLIPGVARGKHLENLLHEQEPESAIIFTNTRRDANRVSQRLNRAGLESRKLSGDMDQPERDRVMHLMKSKAIRFLVATDVAARGIDISKLSHVIHYQMPETPEVYIHRSGRTGRAGSKGLVISLASSQNLGVIYALRRYHELQLIERPLPEQAKKDQIAKAKAKAKPKTQAVEQKTFAKKALPSTKKNATPKPSDSEKFTPKEPTSIGETRITHEERLANSTPQPTTKRKRRRREKSQTKTSHQSVIIDKSENNVTLSDQNASTINQLTQKDKLDKIIQSIQGVSSTESLKNIDLQKQISSLSIDELKSLAGHIIDQKLAKSIILGLLKLIQTRNDGLSEDNHTSQIYSESPSTTSKQNLKPSQTPDIHWLKINLGWQDNKGGYTAIKEEIAELGGLLPEDILQLKVKKKYSIFQVQPEFEGDLVTAIQGELYRQKTLNIEIE